MATTTSMNEQEKAQAENYVKYFENTREDKITEAYDQAAHMYNATYDAVGYPDPTICFELMDSVGLPKDSAIVDLGCGTGLSAKGYAEAGYTNIVGMDPSEGMRTEAMKTGYFKEVREFWLERGQVTEDLREKFDIVSCCGVFFSDHVSPEGFHDLLDMCKVGGHIVTNYREDQDATQKNTQKLNELIEAGKWEIVLQKRYTKYTKCQPGQMFWFDGGVQGVAYVLKKLSN